MVGTSERKIAADEGREGPVRYRFGDIDIDKFDNVNNMS